MICNLPITTTAAALLAIASAVVEVNIDIGDPNLANGEPYPTYLNYLS